MLKPIWGQIWSCTKKSQTKTIQAFQSITLCLPIFASLYISNNSIHNYLNIETINTVASNHYKKFHFKLAIYTDPLMANQGGANFSELPPPSHDSWKDAGTGFT